MVVQLEGYWMDVGQPKDYLSGPGPGLEVVRKVNVTTGIRVEL